MEKILTEDANIFLIQVFFFFKVSIVMNKVLHLKCCCYFSLVMTTASSYMIAALQKRSHKKIKGEMVGKPHQG